MIQSAEAARPDDQESERADREADEQEEQRIL